MTKNNEIEKIERSRKIGLFSVVLFAVSGIVLGCFSWHKCIQICHWRMEDLATSLAGTTGLLWSGAGIILVYVVYLGQRIEIIQQRVELEENRKQLTLQAESLQKQNDISLAAQDYEITKGLIDEFCLYLNRKDTKYANHELMRAIQSDFSLYISKVGTHEDKYLEYLQKFTEAEAKRGITRYAKFALAAILYKFRVGRMHDQQKAILLNRLFQDFRNCYLGNIYSQIQAFDISRHNGNEPRFSHPDFEEMEALFKLMYEFEKLYADLIPNMFKEI